MVSFSNNKMFSSAVDDEEATARKEEEELEAMHEQAARLAGEGKAGSKL